MCVCVCVCVWLTTEDSVVPRLLEQAEVHSLPEEEAASPASTQSNKRKQEDEQGWKQKKKQKRQQQQQQQQQPRRSQRIRSRSAAGSPQVGRFPLLLSRQLLFSPVLNTHPSHSRTLRAVFFLLCPSMDRFSTPLGFHFQAPDSAGSTPRVASAQDAARGHRAAAAACSFQMPSISLPPRPVESAAAPASETGSSSKASVIGFVLPPFVLSALFHSFVWGPSLFFWVVLFAGVFRVVNPFKYTCYIGSVMQLFANSQQFSRIFSLAVMRSVLID